MNTLATRRGVPSRFELFPFDTLLREYFGGEERTGNGRDVRLLPPVEVSETDKEFLVAMDLPGFEENDVQVRITGDQLVVSGERKQRRDEKDKHYHRVETSYGAFERRFDLPDGVRKDAEGVKATSHKGVLEIRLPKAEVRPPARIQIKTV